ncbi:MAG TPA: GNAT family N-acetyltransferase [Pirellulaceae bacterium]|nr:GNAT family N-acetyltransferase [Pirellulaceae bacterium]
MERDDTPTVLTATVANRVQSLWLVLSSFPAEERADQVASMMATAVDPETTFADLLIARRDKQIVAATWVQAAPGRTAVVWPPQLIEGEPEATAAALFKEVDARLEAGDADLAQAIQMSEEGEIPARLRRHGFKLAARLLYLIYDLGSTGDVGSTGDTERIDGVEPVAEAQGSPLEFEPFGDSEADRLMTLVEKTYVDTQDIPVLNNLRTMADVLDGYRHTGCFDPHNWFFVQLEGSDIGCLLLADHPAMDQVELIYMGVVPEARGKGLGRRITERAKRHTLQAGRRRLILGVDADNSPALLTYTSAGFRRCQERWVFLRSLRN